MKILFVSSGNSKYKIVPFIKRQGESLRKEGLEVDFFTIQGRGIIGYLKNIKELKTKTKNKKYDIIHAHYGLVGLVTVLANTKRPIILSVMGSDAYGSFDTDGKRRKISYFVIFFTQIAMFLSKKIIVKSKNILDVVPSKKKSYIIPNGVDLELFKPNSNNLENHNVLFLANPKDPRKNYKLVQNAVKSFDENINLINPFPIEPDKFPNYLNSASVFILTSYNEGSPNVIKEAMACNIPIVSTDVGDVKEVIGNTEGCYITSFDPKDVAEKIKLALEFAEKKGTTKGRERLIELGLDSKTVAQKIIEVYKEVLKN